MIYRRSWVEANLRRGEEAQAGQVAREAQAGLEGQWAGISEVAILGDAGSSDANILDEGRSSVGSEKASGADEQRTPRHTVRQQQPPAKQILRAEPQEQTPPGPPDLGPLLRQQ